MRRERFHPIPPANDASPAAGSSLPGRPQNPVLIGDIAQYPVKPAFRAIIIKGAISMPDHACLHPQTPAPIIGTFRFPIE
jgi:hypothetical protein